MRTGPFSSGYFSERDALQVIDGWTGIAADDLSAFITNGACLVVNRLGFTLAFFPFTFGFLLAFFFALVFRFVF